jgi:hypothetical protein
MWHPARSGEYIVFAQPYKDYAELETLLANIMGLYDAVVYATQGNLPLLPVSQMWMESIKEVPYLSDYACMIANYFPTLYDNGGAETETFYEIDETTDIMWMDYFGIPEWYDALALFRSTSCADNPQILTMQSIANDKISFKGATVSATSFTEVAKTDLDLDWIRSTAGARSATQVGLFSTTTTKRTPLAERFDNVLDGAGAATAPGIWDKKAAQFVLRHLSGLPLVVKTFNPLLPDLIVSGRRMSGRGSGLPIPPRRDWPLSRDAVGKLVKGKGHVGGWGDTPYNRQLGQIPQSFLTPGNKDFDEGLYSWFTDYKSAFIEQHGMDMWKNEVEYLVRRPWE